MKVKGSRSQQSTRSKQAGGWPSTEGHFCPGSAQTVVAHLLLQFQMVLLALQTGLEVLNWMHLGSDIVVPSPALSGQAGRSLFEKIYGLKPTTLLLSHALP